MKTIWIITVSDVQECMISDFEPEAFMDYETAKARFDELYDEQLQVLKENPNIYDTSDKGENWFEFWLEGYYSSDHYRCSLQEIEIR